MATYVDVKRMGVKSGSRLWCDPKWVPVGYEEYKPATGKG